MLKVKHVMWFFSFLAKLLAKVEKDQSNKAEKTAASMTKEAVEHQRRMDNLMLEKTAAEAEAMKAFAAHVRLRQLLGE